MPRLVRRTPLAERVKAMLNPMDFLLWLSEEIETRDWDSKSVGIQIGVAMNFIFAVARANSSNKTTADDVFGDGGGSGWLTFFVGTFVWVLAGFSTLNAVYTTFRTRKYRLFEADVEKEYSTPSAHRVRVQSSPASSSPLRFLTDLVSSDSAESRAHPDRTRDVWELAIWDPLPISLQILCWFGPGHVLVSWMFLPVSHLDAWPSITGFKWFVLQAIISTQMYLMQSKFSQQNKDTAIIQKEVMHEYDTKFVHPHLYPIVRDASTQISQDEDGNDQEYVGVGTPTTVLRRGFKANPNPNYARHIDPDGTALFRSSPSKGTNPGLFTPPISKQSDIFASSIVKTRPLGLRRSTPSFSTSVSRTNSPAVSTSTNTTQTQAPPQGGGGYLGVYSHPSSPLKKAPSLGELHHRTPRNNSEMAQLEQYQAYKDRSTTSPSKSARKSVGSLPSSTQTGPAPWTENRGQPQERYPSMWR